MGILPALFLDVSTFAKTHCVGRNRVLRLMDIGRIPEVPSDGGKRYVDMVDLLERMQARQFKLTELYDEDE
ncbi:hypothetical protein A9D46_14860 [Photobacterium damselae subsp. damselae]|uniref:hypothetical protein n=1 Tax=Photobacterium damselae TaxID=38293 RepID=UPI00084B5840|nr:hypothetical protein [Photobacterium damselae]OEC82341.1 hypothetical protein A9D46_14860 [Photobacterium damselae subsp. damselae]